MSATRIEVTALDGAIRQWAAQRHLSDAHLRRWLALAHEDRAALLDLVETVRLRTGQFVIAFEMLEEIALRERATIAGTLARDQIRRILYATGSAPGRARELIDTLRRIRFPHLMRAAERLAAEITALRLPPGVKVVLPKQLSSDEVRVEISAHGAADLERLIDSVTQARAGLGRIADLIGGADSIDDEI